MSKKYFSQLLIGVLLFSITALSAQSESNSIKIAFMGLVPRGDMSPGQDKIVTDLLLAEIIKTNTFELIERQQLNSLIDEQALQLSGYIDNASDETLIELGKMAAVKLLLMGSIGELENKTAITVRLVDAETAKIVFANTLVSRPNELSDGIRVLAREISRSGLQTTMVPTMEKIQQAREGNQPEEALMLARKMMEINPSPEFAKLLEELRFETAQAIYKEAKRALRHSAWDRAVTLADEAVLLDPDPLYLDFRFKALSAREKAIHKEALKKEKMQRSEEERREREAAGLITFGDHVKNYYNEIEPGGFRLGYVSGASLNDQQDLDNPFLWSGGEFSYTGTRETALPWVYKAWSLAAELSTQDSEEGDKNFVFCVHGSPFMTWYFGSGNIFLSPSFDTGIIFIHGPSENFAIGGSAALQGSLELKILKTIGFYSTLRLEYDWIYNKKDLSGLNPVWSIGLVL